MTQFRTIGLVLVFGLCTLLSAQQSGDGDRDFTVNGQGSLQTSVVLSTVSAQGTLDLGYQTSAAFAPIVLYASPTASVGFLVTAANSIDIDLVDPGAAIVLNGTPPGLASLFLRTDATQGFNLSVPLDGAFAGVSTNLMMGHFDGASPDGFYVSQVHGLSFAGALGASSLTTNGAATPIAVNVADDDSVQVSLGFGSGLNFYGTNYSDCWVGSNGFLTFGAADLDFSESVADLLSGAPRISMLWDDLDPSAGGSILVYANPGADVFELSFVGVQRFGDSNPLTFIVVIDATSPSAPVITMDYATLSGSAGLVGLSPGAQPGPVPALGSALDLSIGGALGTADTAYYELFDGANPLDLGGFQVVWTLDAAGQPLAQN